MKKAIVTGATGFIGSSFVEFLCDKGIDVLSLGRKKISELSTRRKKKIEKSTYVQISMNEISNLKYKIREIKWSPGDACVFYNLAWGGINQLSDLSIEAQMENVSESVSALETANELKCLTFCQIGTMEEAFTYKYMELDYNKDSEYNRHVIYASSKIAAKYALKANASRLDINFIYVLHSHVMGVDDYKDSFLQVTLKKLMEKKELIFSSGEQYFDVISVFDCCNGYYLIGKKGKHNSEYWVGSGDPRKLRNYVERMYKLYPSGEEMQFGKLEYNDVKLSKSDFSIKNLYKDTGYQPKKSYEQVVVELYDYFKNNELI